MSQLDSEIQDLRSRILLLIQRNKDYKTANAELKSILEAQNKEIENLRKQIAEKEKQYTTLVSAKMINVTDNNIDDTRKKVNNLIRTVNQCITLLSEK